MKHRNIIRQAYHLTIRNPILWAFGLFLTSGFNLNTLYASVSQQSGAVWQTLRGAMSSHPFLLGAAGAGVVILFLATNFLKAWFISEVHERLHPDGLHCPLCSKREQRQTWQQRLPGLLVLARVLLASGLTVLVTIITIMPLNYLLTTAAGQPSPAVISITFLATLIIVCALALWNTFTVFYIVLHRQNFPNAARLSVDLITMRAKPVFEFVVLLIILYLAVVVIGSFLILVSQFKIDLLPAWATGVLPVLAGGRAIAGILFAAWLAITNVFFNICLLIFFDHLVKPISKEEPVTTALPTAVQ